MGAAVIGVIGVLLGTIAGSVVTHLLDMRREREAQRKRESHEMRIQRQSLDFQRQSWLVAERRRAYAHLATLTATVDSEEPYELKDLSESYSEIKMLSSSGAVVESARTLHGAQFRARKKAREIKKRGEDPAKDEEYLTLHRDKETYRENFIELARTELGLDARPGHPGV